MNLTNVDEHRSGVVQFLILVIMAVLGFFTYISLEAGTTPAAPVLSIVALLACFYAIVRERGLRRLHGRLVGRLTTSERQVSQLGEEVDASQQLLGEASSEKEALRHRLDELTALYRAISRVNSVADPRKAYDAVLAAALELVEADCGSVMLLEGRDLPIVAAQGLSYQVIQQARPRLGEGVAGWVAEHREPVLLTGEATSDVRFTEVEDRDVALEFSMSVPLESKGRVLGVLNFGSTSDDLRTRFSADELSMASIFAQHASVAIENAQLLEDKLGSRGPSELAGGRRAGAVGAFAG